MGAHASIIIGISLSTGHNLMGPSPSETLPDTKGSKSVGTSVQGILFDPVTPAAASESVRHPKINNIRDGLSAISEPGWAIWLPLKGVLHYLADIACL